MENKTASGSPRTRSAGVILLALSLIVLSIFRLLGTTSMRFAFSFAPAALLMIIVIYTLAHNILTIIGAINLFRLKEWARKLIIILTIIQIVYMAFVSIPLSHKSIENQRQSEDTMARIEAGYQSVPADIIEEKGITLDVYVNKVLGAVHTLAFIIAAISFAYLGLIIYFFTRPKVKEQFAG
jgi:hypothetical protein